MDCEYCGKRMSEGELLDGPRYVGSFWDCDNKACPFLVEKGRSYSTEKDLCDLKEEARDEAAEHASDLMRDK